MERSNLKKLAKQIKKHVKKPIKKKKKDGNTKTMISTSSTLLDLAIAGTRIRGGGIPGGILVEIFGPSSSGKTVLLFELGGSVQRNGGEAIVNDPEARMDKKFAKQFDFDLDSVTMKEPDTVTQVMDDIKAYNPKNKDNNVNAFLTDSLAALSTTLEMTNKKGDKMGMSRAKELSTGLRKICRLIKQRNQLLIFTNQIRVNVGASQFSEKFTVPGGKAIEFYSSLRLRFMKAKEVKKEISFKGKKIEETVGTKVTIKIYKNSVDEGYRSADIYIMKGYGIDDIRANLQFLKDYSNKKIYFINKRELEISMAESIEIIEAEGLEAELKEAVIDLWEEIQEKFKTKRKKKRR